MNSSELRERGETIMSDLSGWQRTALNLYDLISEAATYAERLEAENRTWRQLWDSDATWGKYAARIEQLEAENKCLVAERNILATSLSATGVHPKTIDAITATARATLEGGDNDDK
ncbi:MAG: hypothetical protein ACOCSK_00320 [Rhodothermales bacterium]